MSEFTRDDWLYLPWDSQEAMEVTEPRPGEGPDAWQARAPTWTYTCKEMTIPLWIAYRKTALRQLRRRQRHLEFIPLPPTDTSWPQARPNPPQPMTPLRLWIHRRFMVPKV